MPTIFSKLKLRSLSSQAAQSNISIDASGYVAEGVDKFDERKLPTLSVLDKSMTSIATSGDNSQASSDRISEVPKDGSYVEVKVNGIEYEVGNGVKTKACYFSGDGGVTARSFNSSHVNGKVSYYDLLYWNGDIAGFDIVPGWRISVNYLRCEYDQLILALSILEEELDGLNGTKSKILTIINALTNELNIAISNGDSDAIVSLQQKITTESDSLDTTNAAIELKLEEIDALQTEINTIP